MGKDEIINKVIVVDIRFNDILGLDFMIEYWLRKCVYGLRDKRFFVLGLIVVMMIVFVDCVNGGCEGIF